MQNPTLLGFLQRGDQAERVVGIERCYRLGQGFRAELLSDLVANGFIQLGQDNRIKFRAKQLDKLGSWGRAASQ